MSEKKYRGLSVDQHTPLPLGLKLLFETFHKWLFRQYLIMFRNDEAPISRASLSFRLIRNSVLCTELCLSVTFTSRLLYLLSPHTEGLPSLPLDGPSLVDNSSMPCFFNILQTEQVRSEKQPLFILHLALRYMPQDLQISGENSL